MNNRSKYFVQLKEIQLGWCLVLDTLVKSFVLNIKKKIKVFPESLSLVNLTFNMKNKNI